MRVYAPGHPGADAGGYVARNRLVAEELIGRHLLPDEVVHHKNEDQSDDSPGNLEVLANQAEHARLHGLRRTAAQMAAMRAGRSAS